MPKATPFPVAFCFPNYLGFCTLGKTFSAQWHGAASAVPVLSGEGMLNRYKRGLCIETRKSWL